MDDRLKAVLEARGQRALVRDALRAEAADTRYLDSLLKAVLGKMSPGSMEAVFSGFSGARTFWVDMHTEYSRTVPGASRTAPALFTRTDRGITVFRHPEAGWESLGAHYPTQAEWTLLREYGPHLAVSAAQRTAGPAPRGGYSPADKRQARAYGRRLARELYAGVTGPVAVLLDVSGSVDRRWRDFEAGFCDELARHATVSVSLFDTGATELAPWNRKAAAQLDAVVGGGTDVEAALNATAVARGATPTIVVTDGECNWPAALPASVACLIVNDRDFSKAGWGPALPAERVVRRPASPMRGQIDRGFAV